MDKDTKSTILAIILTGAVSTAGNVVAMNVHLDYLTQSVKRNEMVNNKQEDAIRQLELMQAALAKNQLTSL